MKNNYTILLVLLIAFLISCASAQSIDSLLQKRLVDYNNYTKVKNNKSERTWTNLKDLNTRADDLIETDEMIIGNYLQNEMFFNRHLRDSIEKVNLELSLYKKEAEINNTNLKEQKGLVNILLFIIAGISVLMLLTMILLFRSHTHNVAARKELKRLWRKKDETDQKAEIGVDKDSLIKKIAKLSEENDLLKKRIESIDKLKLNAEAKLKEEISSRREAEKEIRSLIDQIKK